MTEHRPGPDEGPEIGVVVGGSLSQGVKVKLARTRSVEQVAVGAYVAIEGRLNRTFGMITDVTLETIDSSLEATMPDLDDPFIADVLDGTAFYGTVDVQPELSLDQETNETRRAYPAASLLQGG